MRSEFEEFNVFVYYAIVNGSLDAVIWCLGPLVDDSREYGYCRLFLAAVTCKIVRGWLKRKGVISETA